MPISRTLERLTGVFLLLALVLTASAYALAQARNADTVAIRDPNGIDEAEFVPITGLDQWITIRGQDRRKPVVLILHGGPGQAQSHLIQRMLPMEKDFVVVHGISAARARPWLTLAGPSTRRWISSP